MRTQQGLGFLEGSFQCGWRTADVANYPTDGENGRENEETEGKKEWGKRSHLAVNSSSCPSGSAEPGH